MIIINNQLDAKNNKQIKIKQKKKKLWKGTIVKGI